MDLREGTQPSRVIVRGTVRKSISLVDPSRLLRIDLSKTRHAMLNWGLEHHISPDPSRDVLVMFSVLRGVCPAPRHGCRASEHFEDWSYL
jgi:hypothetical protein